MQLTLGIDIGGVILDKAKNDGTDTSFLSDNYLRTTTTPGAVEAIQRLVKEKFGDRVHVVSKCGPKVQDKSLRWLDHHDFYARTGISDQRIHFCLKRYQKAGICKDLGITHFIDDKLEVLSYLVTVPKKYLFHPEEPEVQRYIQHLPSVTRVENWAELLGAELS